MTHDPQTETMADFLFTFLDKTFLLFTFAWGLGLLIGYAIGRHTVEG